MTITGDETGGKVYFDKIPLTTEISDWRKIPLGGSRVLGQQQDSFLGGYDENDRLKGSICNFQMWDFKLSNEQLDLLVVILHPSSPIPIRPRTLLLLASSSPRAQ